MMVDDDKANEISIFIAGKELWKTMGRESQKGVTEKNHGWMGCSQEKQTTNSWEPSVSP